MWYKSRFNPSHSAWFQSRCHFQFYKSSCSVFTFLFYSAGSVGNNNNNKIKRYNTKKGLIEQVFSRLNCSTDSFSVYQKSPADTTICIFKRCVELWMCDSLRFPVWWWMMIKLSLSRLFFASLSKGPFYAHWFWSFVVIVLTPARPSMPTNNNSFFFCGL